LKLESDPPFGGGGVGNVKVRTLGQFKSWSIGWDLYMKLWTTIGCWKGLPIGCPIIVMVEQWKMAEAHGMSLNFREQRS